MTEKLTERLTAVGILREALSVPSRSWKLTASVILLVIAPFYLITLCSDLVLTPVVRDLQSEISQLPNQKPDSSEAKAISDVIQKDTRALLAWEALFLIAFAVAALFALIAAVYSSAMIYTRKQLTHRVLFSAMITGGAWKRAIITWFYVCLFSVAYVLVISVMIGISAVIAKGAAFVGLVVLLAIVGVVFYVYLSAVWMLGLVISVVQEDCYGLLALGRAAELIKGRRLQGFFLMLLLSVLAITITISFKMMMGGLRGNHIARLAIGLVMISLACLVKLFISVVYTVFYFDCIDEKEAAKFGEGALYALAFNEVV